MIEELKQLTQNSKLKVGINISYVTNTSYLWIKMYQISLLWTAKNRREIWMCVPQRNIWEESEAIHRHTRILIMCVCMYNTVE